MSYPPPVVPVLPLDIHGGRTRADDNEQSLQRPSASAAAGGRLLERGQIGARAGAVETAGPGDILDNPGVTSRTLRALRRLCSGGKFARQYARAFLSAGPRTARVTLVVHQLFLVALLVGGVAVTFYCRTWEAGAGALACIGTFGNIVADICDELDTAPAK